MHHPWRAFRDLSSWTLAWSRMPGTLVGLTDFDTRTITLDDRQLQVERRCTIAHEIVHVLRGPLPADPRLAALEERAVEQETANRLIPLDRLIDALRWASCPAEAADELWVTVDVLETRLRHLHVGERRQLQQLLERDP